MAKTTRESTGESTIRRFATACARGSTLFIALFTLLNLADALLGHSIDQNIWWIDLSFLPVPVAIALQGTEVFLFLWFTLSPRSGLPRRIATTGICIVLALCALQNAYVFFELVSLGSIRVSFPLPFSFFIVLVFAFLAIAVFLNPRDVRPAPKSLFQHIRSGIGVLLAVCAIGFLFPVAQMICFGSTDYRRPVDAVVILGAKVQPDGTLSATLEERVLTGVELYKEGLTDVIIMSGGTGDEGVSEAVAMKEYAVKQGIPASAILTDEFGVSTDATVENTMDIFTAKGHTSVAVVSTFYHLPRVKMAYLMQGIDVYTVPAQSYREVPNIELSMLREIPGWWVYWFRGLAT